MWLLCHFFVYYQIYLNVSIFSCNVRYVKYCMSNKLLSNASNISLNVTYFQTLSNVSTIWMENKEDRMGKVFQVSAMYFTAKHFHTLVTVFNALADVKKKNTRLLCKCQELQEEKYKIASWSSRRILQIALACVQVATILADILFAKSSFIERMQGSLRLWAAHGCTNAFSTWMQEDFKVGSLRTTWLTRTMRIDD